MNIYEYAFTSITGTSLPMSRFQGQPVLLVNTASRCGYTPQYAKLQKVWEEYREAGLVVLAIPSNDFGEQEPGEDDIIAHFCETNYRVSFPMTTKMHVVGAEMHPIFTRMMQEHGVDILPKWNFYKYFFDRNGDLLEHWPSAIEPDDPTVTHQIERNINSWIL